MMSTSKLMLLYSYATRGPQVGENYAMPTNTVYPLFMLTGFTSAFALVKSNPSRAITSKHPLTKRLLQRVQSTSNFVPLPSHRAPYVVASLKVRPRLAMPW